MVKLVFIVIVYSYHKIMFKKN